MSELPYLNLGCGITYNSKWTNVDFVSTGEGVMARNLLEGIPFDSKKFEVVYHSHMLEHFPKSKARELIKECYRVLKPGGILRVVIPDLEQIALNYIKYLKESLEGKPGAKEKYEWSMLELFDQVVRTVSGGEMLDYIKDTSKNNDEFLLQRNGHEVKRIMDSLRVESKKEVKESAKSKKGVRQQLYEVKTGLKGKLKKQLTAEEQEAINIGRFRLGGEVHQWMYDRFSLKVLLESAGFKNCEVKTAFESGIPGWNKFNLDGNFETKEIRKPDSLFMEAVK